MELDFTATLSLSVHFIDTVESLLDRWVNIHGLGTHTKQRIFNDAERF